MEYSGKLWMERPVFHLLDRENMREREKSEMESSGEGVRAREARKVRERS